VSGKAAIGLLPVVGKSRVMAPVFDARLPFLLPDEEPVQFPAAANRRRAEELLLSPARSSTLSLEPGTFELCPLLTIVGSGIVNTSIAIRTASWTAAHAPFFPSHCE
jgi:hypothetical protein